MIEMKAFGEAPSGFLACSCLLLKKANKQQSPKKTTTTTPPHPPHLPVTSLLSSDARMATNLESCLPKERTGIA